MYASLASFWGDVFAQVLHAALESDMQKWQGQDSKNRNLIVDYMSEVALDICAMETLEQRAIGRACYPALTTMATKGFSLRQKAKAFILFVRMTVDGGSLDEAKAGLKLCALLARQEPTHCYDVSVLGLRSIVKHRLWDSLDDIHRETDLSTFVMAQCTTAIQWAGMDLRRAQSCISHLDFWIDLGVLQYDDTVPIMMLFLNRLQEYENQAIPASDMMETKKFRDAAMCALLHRWVDDDFLGGCLETAYHEVSKYKTFHLDFLPAPARNPLQRLSAKAHQPSSVESDQPSIAEAAQPPSADTDRPSTVKGIWSSSTDSDEELSEESDQESSSEADQQRSPDLKSLLEHLPRLNSDPTLLNKYAEVLDLVESSRSSNYLLLGPLFRSLQQLVGFSSQTGATIDNLFLPLLRSLHVVTDSLHKGLAGGMIRNTLRSDCQMDTLVKCVTESQNVAIQREGILLISKLATWSPELVLDGIVPIFTFIGSNTIRSSDDFSLHLTIRTIENVIPPLAASIKRKTKNPWEIVAGLYKVLNSFVAAWPDIPSERRMHIFERLVRILGPEDYLFVLLTMVSDHHSTNNSARQFICDLVAKFEPIKQVITLKRSFELLVDLCAPNEYVAKRTFSDAVFDIKRKTAVQQQEAAISVLKTLRLLMDRHDLKTRVARLLPGLEDEDTDDSRDVREVVWQSIALVHVTATQNEDFLQAASISHTRTLQMVPFGHMVRMISWLLQNQKCSDDLRHAALTALMGQFPKPSNASTSTVQALLHLLDDICSMMQKTEMMKLKHLAMSCINQIIVQYGKRHRGVTFATAESISSDIALGSADRQLQIQATNTLASMAAALGEEFLPLVPNVLDQTFSNLANVVKGKASDMQTSILALLNAIVTKLAYTLSDENLDAALELCFQMAPGHPLDDSPARTQFYRHAGLHLDTTKCLDSIKRVMPAAVQAGPEVRISDPPTHSRCANQLPGMS